MKTFTVLRWIALHCRRGDVLRVRAEWVHRLQLASYRAGNPLVVEPHRQKRRRAVCLMRCRG